MAEKYRVAVRVTEYDTGKKEAIKNSANKEWSFQAWDEVAAPEPALRSENVDYLRGDPDLVLVSKITNAIWAANGKFCNVRVETLYIENVPVNSYQPTEDEYREFLAKQ